LSTPVRVTRNTSTESSASVTLDVWDGRMAELGERLGREREALVSRLEPLVVEAYARLAGESAELGLAYCPP